ncbi:MAG: hypothetical protein V3V45_02000 [Candidatus Brocadiales bacterium]
MGGGDLTVWAVLFLLLFGGSLIKAIIKWRAHKREEAQKPVTERGQYTFWEELKKSFEDMMAQREQPEIVIEEEEEEPYLERPKRIKVRVTAPPTGLAAEAEQPTEDERRVKLTAYAKPPPGKRHRKLKLSEILPKNELQRAVVMSEILGPPRAKRRTHRLF